MTASLKAGFTPQNRPYDVLSYKITIKLDVTSDEFHNSVRIDFKPLENIKELELDSVGLAINQVLLLPEKESLNFTLDIKKGLLNVQFDEQLDAEATHTIEIDYSGKADTRHEGLFKVLDPDYPERLPLYFTHFEPIAGRKFFPSNDEPYDKATTEVIVEVNEPRYSVLANGRKLPDELYKDSENRSWRKCHWVMDKPHSSYLVNVAIGEFEDVAETSSKIPFHIYVAPQKADDVRFAMDMLKGSFQFFENFYGIRYPWSQYSMVGIPGFLWGGMENTTLTSMRESLLSIEDPSAVLQQSGIAAVVAHELAHQWFGDYVTMKWWDDLWLNEAFASYMETLASEDLSRQGLWTKEYPIIEIVTGVWEGYFRQEDGPRSHPIVTRELPSPDDAFDSINYTKGEQVLRMLDFSIGREAFQKGVAHYMKKFGFSNATYKDFFDSMEEASGVDLKGFINSWLIHRGYPIVTIRKKWQAKTKTLEIDLIQKPNHPEDKTVFDFKLPIAFYRRENPAYAQTQVFDIKEKGHNFLVSLPAEPDWVSVNPGGIALARFDMPDTKKVEWSRQAVEDPDPIARIAALFHLAKPWIDREAKKLGRLSRLAKRTLNNSLREESSTYVRWALLKKLVDAKWTRFPNDLAQTVFENASNPQNIQNKSPIGEMLLRASATTLLGKLDYSKGKDYLYAQVYDKNLPLDLVSATAGALARLGDEVFLGRLKEMQTLHEPRGYPFKKYILVAFGSVSNTKVVPDLYQITSDPKTNNEIAGGILRRLYNNETVKTSRSGAKFIQDFALKNTSFSDEMKARALEVLEEVKNADAKKAVVNIAKNSSSERLRALAQKILEKNFPD